jgi:hypothetical protein
MFNYDYASLPTVVMGCKGPVLVFFTIINQVDCR